MLADIKTHCCRLTERAYHATNLVQSHGKQAVSALAARGVGLHNAARIIGKRKESETDFYRDNCSQEHQYARTKALLGLNVVSAEQCDLSDDKYRGRSTWN